MLQLSENKRRRPAQIAKKFKNAFLRFWRSFSSSSAAKRHAVLLLNTTPLPRIGVFPRPVLPWIHHHQPAISAISAQAWGRRGE
jgi:hypothetical protein